MWTPSAVFEMDNARIIRAFVENPSDPRRWRAAWDLTIEVTIRSLRSWESRGRHLPLELFAGDQRHRDLAVEVVYELFTRNKSGEFPLARFLLPQMAEPDDVFLDHYLGIVRKTARQNAHKLEQDEAPDAWNIRRNIRHALRDSDGEFRDESDGRSLEWSWTHARFSTRRPLPLVDDTSLRAWVTSACREEAHTPGQCRHVFTKLDSDDRFRNTLLYYPLVKTFIAVLLDHQPPVETLPESPLLLRLRGLLRDAAPVAEKAVLTNDLPHLAKLAGLTAEEVHGIETALHTWLDDFLEHIEADSLRTYLSEQLGDVPLKVYQKRYHYLWNTLTGKCRDRIVKDVRNRMGLE